MIKADLLTIFNSLILLSVAVLQFLNNRAMRAVREDVRKVELATNSLQDKMIAAKDAEVLATAAAQHAIGLAAGIIEGKADQKIADQKIADQKK